MSLRTSNLADELLVAVHYEAGRLADVARDADWKDRYVSDEFQQSVADAGSGIVAFDLELLLGRIPDESERRAVHRALARLEKFGLLRKLRRGHVGRRVTHLQLLAEVVG
jgi:hypothetical protein